MENRQYQTDIQNAVRRSMQQGHKSILVQLCTGGGKTNLATEMIKAGLLKNRRSHFAVHRKILLKQTRETFERHEVPYGFLAADYDFNPYSSTHICSIDTLYSRLGTFDIPDILWVDECHMANSPTWSMVLDYYRWAGAWIVGLTATPIRTDGTGLRKNFTDMICGPSMRWLIDQGFLSDFRMFSPSNLNLKGLGSRAGDYDPIKLAAMMEANSSIIGDSIKHYRQHAMDTLNIPDCVSRKHSEMTAEKFRDNGIVAVHIDGYTPAADRERIIKAYARREIKILTNVELITTGFDLAAQVGDDVNVESISLMRPTKSLSLYLQMVGRGLRRKSKPAIILDHANCRLTFGLPDDDYDWTLEDREIQKRGNKSEVAVRHCNICHFDHRPKPSCPNCGHIYEIKYREVDHVDGDLVEVDKETRRVQAELDAKNLEMMFRDGQSIEHGMEYLVKLGRRKGYKNPEKWAAHIISARLAKKGRKK
jgi:DNA repair protein RadD